jgi:hypothetical protein
MIAPIVNTLGKSLVKPSVYFSPTDQAISKRPATRRMNHAMMDPFTDSFDVSQARNTAKHRWGRPRATADKLNGRYKRHKASASAGPDSASDVPYPTSYACVFARTQPVCQLELATVLRTPRHAASRQLKETASTQVDDFTRPIDKLYVSLIAERLTFRVRTLSPVRRGSCNLDRRHPRPLRRPQTMASYVNLSDEPREVPLSLRSRRFVVTKRLHATTRHILTSTLARFARRIQAIDVWLEDVNGPRGGIDTRCRIYVELRPRGRISVSGLAADEYSAIANAAVRARESLDRRIKKARALRRQPVRT